MHNDVEDAYDGDNINEEWTLVDDSTIRTNPGAKIQCEYPKNVTDIRIYFILLGEG
jgi:hypothetical protein